jgi:HD-GYP domain-containing protein (c-di-GMP phosphodiesterase class II)
MGELPGSTQDVGSRERHAVITREDLRPIPVDRLPLDRVLRFPIQDCDGLLLLAAGCPVTPRVLEMLAKRRIKSVLVHREEPVAAALPEAAGTEAAVPRFRRGLRIRVHNSGTRDLDRQLFDVIESAVERFESSAPNGLPDRGSVDYDPHLVGRLCHLHECSVTRFLALCQTMSDWRPIVFSEWREIVDAYLDLLDADPDLFACVAAAPYGTHYPARHALHTTMLSLAIGRRAGLGNPDMVTLAMGALLHDLGMLRVRRQVWLRRTKLAANDAKDLMEHPVHCVGVLARVGGVDADVRCICYQVHERMGGQGYPRQVPGELIHPLARMVAVADTYAALVAPRPYRKAVLPYRAVETVLRYAYAGWLDVRAARLLLESLSLYPVGSYVRLSNRRVGRVLRSNGMLYSRPVVRVWPERSVLLEEHGEIVDLGKHSDLRVIEALVGPKSGADHRSG